MGAKKVQCLKQEETTLRVCTVHNVLCQCHYKNITLMIARRYETCSRLEWKFPVDRWRHNLQNSSSSVRELNGLAGWKCFSAVISATTKGPSNISPYSSQRSPIIRRLYSRTKNDEMFSRRTIPRIPALQRIVRRPSPKRIIEICGREIKTSFKCLRIARRLDIQSLVAYCFADPFASVKTPVMSAEGRVKGDMVRGVPRSKLLENRTIRSVCNSPRHCCITLRSMESSMSR
jgi:hypothetical protein